MALVMSSPILCSSKSLDGPSGELPESPFTFSQALQKVKAVFPNGSPVPTKYEKVAPPFRVLKALRARGADRGLAFRRAKKSKSIRAPGSPPRRDMTAHHDGPTSRLPSLPPRRRKRPSGVLPRIPAFCLSSPSLL